VDSHTKRAKSGKDVVPQRPRELSGLDLSFKVTGCVIGVQYVCKMYNPRYTINIRLLVAED
jgi:hypothetical protein